MKLALLVVLALPLVLTACGAESAAQRDSYQLAVVIDASPIVPEYLGHHVTVERSSAVECRAATTRAVDGVIRCEYVVDVGEEVMLVAESETAEFLGWSDGCDSEIYADGKNECRLTVRDDREIHARFGHAGT